MQAGRHPSRPPPPPPPRPVLLHPRPLLQLEQQQTKLTATLSSSLAPQTEAEYEKEKLNERIARLSGGVAVIQVRPPNRKYACAEPDECVDRTGPDVPVHAARDTSQACRPRTLEPHAAVLPCACGRWRPCRGLSHPSMRTHLHPSLPPPASTVTVWPRSSLNGSCACPFTSCVSCGRWAPRPRRSSRRRSCAWRMR